MNEYYIDHRKLFLLFGEERVDVDIFFIEQPQICEVNKI